MSGKLLKVELSSQKIYPFTTWVEICHFFYFAYDDFCHAKIITENI